MVAGHFVWKEAPVDYASVNAAGCDTGGRLAHADEMNQLLPDFIK